MPRRRQFGSVRRLPSGRYQATYWHDGARHVAPHTFNAKADANTYLATVETDLHRDEWVNPSRRRTPFRASAAEWRNTTVHLKPKTQAGYLSVLNRHVLPAFGDVEIGAIDPPLVWRWIADMQASGLGPDVIRVSRNVLRLVLRSAVGAGTLRANPCDGLRLPRPPHREMRFLDHDQVDSLAEAISHPVLRRPGNGAAPWWRSDLPEYGLLIRLAAYGGLRAGEIGALRVRRVDLGAGSVEVVESVAEVGGRLEIGSTKTYRPRVVPLPRSVVDQLAEHMQGMAEDAFVFTSPTGGPLRHSTFYKRHFRPAVAQAELPADLRFHDLRHTYAGFLIAEGAHPRMMMERLGHSSIQVTLGTYGHLLPSLGEQLTDALDERLRAAVGARVEAVSGEASRTNRAHNQASMNVTN